MQLPRWITDRIQPRRFRSQVEAKAGDFITVHGSLAYSVAREQARSDRVGRRWTESRFWSCVAVEIAKREGRAGEIGVTGADRYPDV